MGELYQFNAPPKWFGICTQVIYKTNETCLLCFKKSSVLLLQTPVH